MDGIYHIYTMDIPWIYHGYTCIWYVYRHIVAIYQKYSQATMCFHQLSVYIMDIPCIYKTYTCIYKTYTCIYYWNINYWYIMCLLFSGFQGCVCRWGIWWYTMYIIYIYHTYVVCIPCIYCLKYFDILAKIFWYAD